MTNNKYRQLAGYAARRFPMVDDAFEIAYVTILQNARERQEKDEPISSSILILRAYSELGKAYKNQFSAYRESDLPEDIQPFEKAAPTDDNDSRIDNTEMVEQLAGLLTTNEKIYIGHKFGVFGFDHLTPQEVAEKYGFRSARQVKTLTDLAMKKLKESACIAKH